MDNIADHAIAVIPMIREGTLNSGIERLVYCGQSSPLFKFSLPLTKDKTLVPCSAITANAALC
jgi:hypothetical protein